MVELLAGVAEALEYVHEQGIVHRDIKPLNLLLSKDGSRLLLTDFGVARDEEASRVTRRGDFLGTIRYMSPEQLLAQRVKVDHRSDIWSFGVSLYEAVTFELPYSGDTEEAYISAVSMKEPLPARIRNPAVSRDLETILMKCLERDPGRRYASAAALKDDLTRYLDERPVAARRPGLLLRIARSLKRQRVAVTGTLLAAVLAVAAVGLLFPWWQGRREIESVRQTLAHMINVEDEAGDLVPGFSAQWWKLQAEVVGNPQGELSILAQRADAEIHVELPASGIAPERPELQVHLRRRWLFRNFPRTSSFLLPCVAELQASWDGAAWKAVFSGAWTGVAAFADLEVYTRSLPAVWKNVASLGDLMAETHTRSSISLERILTEGQLGPGPHELRLRAVIMLLPMDAPMPPQEGGLGALEDWWPSINATLPAFQEVRSLGTHTVEFLTEPRATSP
jgi:hypothetical protein